VTTRKVGWLTRLGGPSGQRTPTGGSAQAEQRHWPNRCLPVVAGGGRGRLEPELAQQQREVDASLDDLLAQLRAADPASSVARAVGDAYGVYHAAVNDQFQLLAKGDLAEAEEVDEQRVDPAFDRLVESPATASRHYGAVAHRANRQADLGTLLLLLAAASVIGVLVWRFQRVKSQAAELFAHQARHDPLTALPARVAQALARSGLDPGRLTLEITETSVVDDLGRAEATLAGLRESGVQIAVDDFGTGFSALGALKHYPVDSLKIDRSFVDGLGSDAQDTAIVHAVIAFAKTLGLQVTGEGIETAEQFEQLRALESRTGIRIG
jgi:EAL domain